MVRMLAVFSGSNSGEKGLYYDCRSWKGVMCYSLPHDLIIKLKGVNVNKEIYKLLN